MIINKPNFNTQSQETAFKPISRILFGNEQKNSVYEKDISINTFDKRMGVGTKQHKIWLLDREKANEIFSHSETNTPNLLNRLLRLALKNSPNRVVNETHNIFSLIKGKSTNQSIVEAFKKALTQIPRGITNIVVSFPAPSSNKPSELMLKKYEDPKIPVLKDLVEQVTLEGYNRNIYRQNKEHPNKLTNVMFNNLSSDEKTASAVKEGKAIGKGMNLARYLVDAPPNIKKPHWVGEEALKMAEQYSDVIKAELKGSAWIQDNRMNLLLAVAKGNNTNDYKDEPRFLEMSYTPPCGKYDKTVLLIGKGITFDTGGVNLKTGADEKTKTPYIDHMHGDMAGAAAVIGAMKTIAEIKIPNVRVIALTPLTPNRMDANSTLPHSIIESRQGKTVAIDNTDAEGRLVLADAINYGGEKYQPDLIVDIATLTGGKSRALGGVNAVALMGNNHEFSKKLEEIEKELGRKTAVLELTAKHQQWVTNGGKGKADVYNSVSLPSAKNYNLFGEGVEFDANNKSHVIEHSAQGGAFLKNFLHEPKTPWVHLDMAGACFESQSHLNGTKYATGFGVKDLYTIVKKVSDGSILK